MLMLVITPIDLADTAIKIGLGALISGLAGYFVAKLSLQKETKRLRTERRSQLLEVVANDVKQFTAAALRQWAFMTNWMAIHPIGSQLDEESKVEFTRIKADMYKAAGPLISAESKVLLLGESKAQELLREYGEFVKPYKEEAVVHQVTVTFEGLRDVRKDILEKRLRLFKELGNAYNRTWS
jgi:hypothetical protein